MALEIATTIADLVTTNPAGASDTPASLDDHIRLIKTVLKADALVKADKGAANGVASLNASGKVVQTALLADSATTATTAANVIFGGNTLSGVHDWNDVSNTRPGMSPTMLQGTDPNGPGSIDYFHVLNFEYSSTDGTGNVTQLAIAYGTPGNKLYMRGRYSDAWSAWVDVVGGEAGAVQMFARNSAPAGWLKANGAAVSRTSYAALYSAIGTTFGSGDGSTTFNLPDLRGEFMRAWDDGRGIDSGRAFGSAQAAGIAAHSHPLIGQLSDVDDRFGGSGLGYGAGQGSEVAGYNTGNSTGTETRPRNIALLACIKF